MISRVVFLVLILAGWCLGLIGVAIWFRVGLVAVFGSGCGYLLLSFGWFAGFSGLWSVVAVFRFSCMLCLLCDCRDMVLWVLRCVLGSWVTGFRFGCLCCVVWLVFDCWFVWCFGLVV